MKKSRLIAGALCVVLALVLFAGCAAETPSSVEGMAYQFIGASLKIPEDITETEKAQMEAAFQKMDPAYANMKLEEILEEISDEMLAGYDTVKPCFYFKENGVLESVYELDGKEQKDQGTYEMKDGKVYITEDGDTYAATLKGNKMYIEQTLQGLTCVLEFEKK